MGANNVLPTVPTFTAGAPTLAQLNQLSYAVSFLVNHDVRPAWTAFMSTATMATTVGAFKTLACDHVAFDSDGVFGAAGVNLPQAIIVTQGFYAVEACFPIQANTSQDNYAVRFQFTAGANNPHFTLGTAQTFGPRGGKLSNSTQGAADDCVCMSSYFTTCCYPGDKIEPRIFVYTNVHTVDKNSNTSYIQGRQVPRFSGRLIATGT